MNIQNLIIRDINALGIGYKKYQVHDIVINSINDNNVKWIDLYAVVNDIKTKEEKKMKIRITGGKFAFLDVDENE